MNPKNYGPGIPVSDLTDADFEAMIVDDVYDDVLEEDDEFSDLRQMDS